MTKLEGPTCPVCGQFSCKHRCNNCFEKLVWTDRYGVTIINPKTGRPIPHDEYGNQHNNCMKGGTKTKSFIKDGVLYVNEKWQDMANYMKNMLRLGADGWWHGWRDGKYVGRVEYAPNDWKSWEPIPEEGE